MARIILSFDQMNFSRGSLTNQYPKQFFINLANLVKANFPGATHIAISTPIDSNAQFIAHGNTPAPLTIEAFIDMQLDAIHGAGLNALIRSDNAGDQRADGFPLTTYTSDQLVARNQAFLQTHVAHLQNGDIVANDYELPGFENQYGTVVNDTGNRTNDNNTFWQKQAAMVAAFATANGFTDLRCRSGAGYSDVVANSISVATVQAQAGVVVYDDYGGVSSATNATPYPTDAQLITTYQNRINTIFNWYQGKYKGFIQEWADIRNSPAGQAVGTIQKSDPNFTGNMADQAIFPAIVAGKLEGVSFWDLANNTSRESILTVGTDRITVTLNPTGQYLATIFQKWWGTSTPPPIAPVSNIALSPAPNSAGNYSNPVTVTLTATASSPNTVAVINYIVDNGTQTAYTTPFTVSGVGQHSVQYWAIDNTGLTEQVDVQNFNIAPPPPPNAPTTTISFTPNPVQDGSYPSNVTATLTATPATGTTIANTYYTVDGGSQTTYSAPFLISGTGDHTITYWSVGSDGGTELTNTVIITISTPLSPPPANLITSANLTSNYSSSGASSYTTASISPKPNALDIVTVVWRATNTTANIPTVTGASGTWVQIGNLAYNFGDFVRGIAMFRDLSASPGSGALTISFGGIAQSNCGWSIDEFYNTEITGTHGSDAIIQFKTTHQQGTNAGLSFSLNTFENPANAIYAGIRQGGTGAVTKGVNFTELSNQTSGNIIETETTLNQPIASWSWANTAQDGVAMAVEIDSSSIPLVIPTITNSTGYLGSYFLGSNALAGANFTGVNPPPPVHPPMPTLGLLGELASPYLGQNFLGGAVPETNPPTPPPPTPPTQAPGVFGYLGSVYIGQNILAGDLPNPEVIPPVPPQPPVINPGFPGYLGSVYLGQNILGGYLPTPIPLPPPPPVPPTPPPPGPPPFPVHVVPQPSPADQGAGNLRINIFGNVVDVTAISYPNGINAWAFNTFTFNGNKKTGSSNNTGGNITTSYTRHIQTNETLVINVKPN